MELYLVRHPETAAPKGTCYGRVNFPLLEPAENTAKRTILNLPPNFDHLISSPAMRAYSLAEELLKHYNLNPIRNAIPTDHRILEMDFGDWDGKLWEELPKRQTMVWMKDFVNQRAPNGEAFTDVIKRTKDFLEDWKPNGKLKMDWEAQNNRNLEKLIVVCHSGSIRALLCQIHNIDFKDAFQTKIDFGSVQKIRL
ncbi:histidine phosphatase family protein [Leptospira sp. 96542]|nr:histidine phosphatase family protein [Leptospira sp. 96542]